LKHAEISRKERFEASRQLEEVRLTMKLALSLVLFIVLVSAFSSTVTAQDTVGAPQTVESLRAQLLDVQAKEAELQARARQLEEDLKPENIERSLAGIGSTRPEELRESRRRQLSIERESVRTQLRLIATSRERLESVIRTAEAQAYQQSAQAGTPLLNQVAAQNVTKSGWVVVTLAVILAILGFVFVIALIKRTRAT
jgi:cell division protein FtsB